MKALVVSGNSPLQTPGQEARWGALSPLVDRPFLQHVVESVVGQGFREIIFSLRAEDKLTREILGDGTRWGAHFEYTELAAGSHLYDAFSEVSITSADEWMLIAHADRLPMVDLDPANSTRTVFCWREGELQWTGWALVQGEDLRRIPKGLEERGLLGFLLKSNCKVVCSEGGRPLTARSYQDVIEANRRVLSREFPEVLFGGREVQPGVWMGRNVSVHPTAKFAAPAFLGENCRIGAMVQVGPGASIGADCLIERETHVSDSVVYGGSYVGRQLALRGVVVDRSRLINTKWGAEIDGVDELLLGSVFGPSMKTKVGRFLGRMAGALGLLVCAPCLAAVFAGASFGIFPKATRASVVHAPTVSGSYRWKTFSLWSFGRECTPEERRGSIRHAFFCFLPALIPIAAGFLHLRGVKPRTRDEVENLPAVLLPVYLGSRLGILPPGNLSFEADGDLAEFEVVEAAWYEPLLSLAYYAGRVLRSCIPSGRRRKVA